MNYNEALEYIHSTPKFRRELGNDMLSKLLAHMDNPQNTLNFIHIAGTNGKGSTAVMLSEVLQRSGYCVGLFTSPFIESFNERIRINGERIPNDELALLVTKLKYIIEKYNTPVSEFALDTSIALLWFQKMNCDIVIWETGLGGRLDATNIIPKSLVSVITAIGFDHMQYLGNTIESITKEKCGIIKNDCPVVSYPIQEEAVFKIIKDTAILKNSELNIADIPTANNGFVSVNDKNYKLGLKGGFQSYNAATALKVIEVLQRKGFEISEKAVEEGLANSVNPARFEVFGRIILDGAHNPHAIKALCKTLKEYKKDIFFCVAMMEDKNYKESAKTISEIADGAIVTQINMPRCCPAEVLADEFKKFGTNAVIELNPIKAVKKALEISHSNALICICGSLYLAGEVRPFLRTIII